MGKNFLTENLYPQPRFYLCRDEYGFGCGDEDRKVIPSFALPSLNQNTH